MRLHPAAEFRVSTRKAWPGIALRVAAFLFLGVSLLGSSCPSGGPNTGLPRVPPLPAEDIASCHLIEGLLANSTLPDSSSLFREVNGACSAVPATQLDGLEMSSLFTDDACSQPVSYRGTSFGEFCGFQLLGTDRTRPFVGNPKAWFDGSSVNGEPIRTPWTLARETTLQVGALDQSELPRPFVQRLEYRRVGDCSLGMRVYVPSLGAENLRPAIVLHGGGWRFRGAGAVAGIGVVAPELTSRGYAVFAPFFRLTGTTDGPAECRGADGRAIVEDVDAAFDWVLEHGGEFGVDPAAGEVAVVGQSSGGHLAAWLFVHHSEAVRRALLLYPLTDVPFLVSRLGPGRIFAGRFDSGEGLLLAYMNEPGVTVAEDLSPDSEFAQLNSFVNQIEAQPDAFGELDIVHGDADTNVPVELSVRLCRARDPALAPSADRWPGGDADLTCGDGGSATIVAGATHLLDLRCLTGDKAQILSLLNERLGGLCTAGSAAQEERVRGALERAYSHF